MMVLLKATIYFSNKPLPFYAKASCYSSNLAFGVSMLTLNAEMLIMLKGHYLAEGLRVDTDNS